MLAKIFIGLTAVSVFALVIVFNLLLTSKEANGKFRGAIDEFGHINARQEVVIKSLEESRLNLLAEVETERVRADRATTALMVSQEGLEMAKDDFAIRLSAARKELSNDELVCATEPVPSAYISSLSD